jgi:hypothetical protein
LGLVNWSKILCNACFSIPHENPLHFSTVTAKEKRW